VFGHEGAYAAEHLQAIDFREIEIEQNDFGRCLRIPSSVAAGEEKVVQRLSAVAHDDNLVGHLAAFEGAQSEVDVVRIVFDE
jgi:hypothetical protein